MTSDPSKTKSAPPREWYILREENSNRALIFETAEVINYDEKAHVLFHVIERSYATELERELASLKSEPITIAHIKACQRNEEYLDKITSLENSLREACEALEFYADKLSKEFKGHNGVGRDMSREARETLTAIKSRGGLK